MIDDPATSDPPDAEPALMLAAIARWGETVLVWAVILGLRVAAELALMAAVAPAVCVLPAPPPATPRPDVCVGVTAVQCSACPTTTDHGCHECLAPGGCHIDFGQFRTPGFTWGTDGTLAPGPTRQIGCPARTITTSGPWARLHATNLDTGHPVSIYPPTCVAP